jgi:predicted aspartyl protease
MAQESGKVNSLREALVEIRFRDGERFECVLDTGFNGALMLPRPFVDHLQIPIIGSLPFEMVGGAKMIGQIALANIEWLDGEREVKVVVSDGFDALIGTELLIGTTLNINYMTRVVTISSARRDG